MISLELARALRDGGLRWSPASGDRFVVVDRGMDSDVFVLADMTVEVHRPPAANGDTVIGFNGTTEWALDSVDQTDAVWLPAEDQLRDRLGETFRSLVRDGTDFVVTVGRAEHRAVSAADAYGKAVLNSLLG